jgi:hypothetical protein
VTVLFYTLCKGSQNTAPVSRILGLSSEAGGSSLAGHCYVLF